jgi:hypothetical protein
MFRRALLVSLSGTLLGMVGLALALRIWEDPDKLHWVYWPLIAAGAFLEGVALSLVAEYLGFYKNENSLWRRFFPRKRD